MQLVLIIALIDSKRLLEISTPLFVSNDLSTLIWIRDDWNMIFLNSLFMILISASVVLVIYKR